MRQRSTRRKAFTLVELLVVIVILSLLVGLLTPNVLKYIGKSKKQLVEPRMAIVQEALNRFYVDYQRFPTDAEGLDILIEDPGDLEGWTRYLKPKQILDPWGNSFVYIAEGMVNPGSFDLISLGADGQDGGEGDNEDVVNDF